MDDDTDKRVEKIINLAAAKAERGTPVARADQIDGFELHEDGIARAFAARHQDTLRYCHSTASWFEWTGKRWRKDETRRAFNWSRLLCRELGQDEVPSKRNKLASTAVAASVERFAQADQGLAVTISIWDADPFLLGTPDGTVELKTGTIRPPSPEDFITKQTAVTPAAVPETPIWDAFLAAVTDNDAGLIRFLRQWAGYTLTGDTREQSLVFIFGPGGNGKGVFLNTISGIMADYCSNSPMDSFTASKNDKHPTDLAMLRGARMVCASETEEGKAWAETRIKSLTGGDTVTARFMRQDFFEYRPQFKITIIGNHRPVLHNVDEAIRRRFNIVPFEHIPAVKDHTLESRLKAEWPGILRWMIEGCLDWQKNGLVRPPVVLAATGQYFSEQDVIAQWLDECCEVTKKPPHNTDTNARLFASWRSYARNRSEEAGTAKTFNVALQRRGFIPVRDTNGMKGRGFSGLRVCADPDAHGDSGLPYTDD